MIRKLFKAFGLSSVCLLLLGVWLSLAADGQSLTIEEWKPRSTLVVEEHPVPRAKFPVIDVHSHHRSTTSPERLDEIVSEMDELNLRVLVNLSGGFGERLKTTVETFPGRHPSRFATFASLNFEGIGNADWGQRAATQLEGDVKNGAQGLKFFKSFGLTMKDQKGERVPVDDPSLEPVWQTCARLKIPVLIHVAEPAEFFKPHDEFNERWLELKIYPRRHRPPDRFPPFETLMAERDRVVAQHPKVNFIIAHFGWHANDLGRLGALMDKYPNFYTETGAILAELGRQPFSGRKFFIKYQDRILFGKDSYRASEFPYYWRVFETRDEYFDYYRHYHAHWQMYGLGLPDEVLKKLYYKNALRLIPGIDSTGFPL
jgi:predicted TIM-barrel fold metal-dependent hydrolase